MRLRSPRLILMFFGTSPLESTSTHPRRLAFVMTATGSGLVSARASLARPRDTQMNRRPGATTDLPQAAKVTTAA